MQSPYSHILLGVSGGIAAYKTPDIVRGLREAGAEVRVVMTENAKAFIAPTSLHAVSGHPVLDDLWQTTAEGGMAHIELARFAEAILIAPASANLIAKLAQGMADCLLTTLCLASQADLYIAPAMNKHMWHHPATQANLATLRARGVHILGPGEGEQACGDVGLGRMLEPEEIIGVFGKPAPQDLAGLSIMVTAGPTREPIDAVRYLSNRSSGKMGHAIAAAARVRGAKVTLVSGPTALTPPPGIQTQHVTTAGEMFDAVMTDVASQDIFISCAAVADFRVEAPVTGKRAKSDFGGTLCLSENPDIVKAVANLNPGPFTVGFAAQTEDLNVKARQKLQSKGLDCIAANIVGDNQAFDSDENALTLLWDGGQTDFPRQAKSQLAYPLLTAIKEQYDAKRATENH